jgi:hypothetical protein
MAANFHKWHVQAAIKHFNEVLAFASLPLVTRQTIASLPGDFWNVQDWQRFLPPDPEDWPKEIIDLDRSADWTSIVPTDPGWVLRYAVTRYKEKFAADEHSNWTADEVQLGVRISLGQFQVGADSLLAAAFHLLKKIEETDP